MASQNPFTTFFTSEDRLSLARKIVQGISDFNPAACAKIALTFALNPSLMDDLTMKDSRRIMELAKLCSEVPWNLPESAVLDPDQSTLAEQRLTDAVPVAFPQSAVATAAASATKAPNDAQQTAVPPLPLAAVESCLSAIPATAPSASAALDTVPAAISDAAAQPAGASATKVSDVPAPLPHVDISSAVQAAAAPGSMSSILSAAQTHVQNAMSSAAPTDHGVFPLSNKQEANIPKTAISTFELSCVNSHAAPINVVVTNIPSANIVVLPSDKQVPSFISSGTLNFQVPSSFSLCSKSESKVLLPFQSSQSHIIKFGSFSQPMSSESVSDLVSSEKLVSDVIKSHDVSLVTKLPTSALSLDSIRVSIPEIQSVPLVSVPFSAPDQCNPVASRTRKSKAKLANRVIPVAPSVKRKLIMDSVSDVEPPRKSQKFVSTRQLRGQVFVPHSLQKSSGFPLPILLNKSVQAAWSFNRDRSLLLQRNIDVENFTACCNLIDLLRSQNLLQTVTNVGPYCDLVTREFYSNLTEATVDRDSDHFHDVFLRRHWYDFSPAVINDFFDRTEVDVQFSPDYDLIASSLSNSHYRTWPKRDTKKPGKQGESTRSRVSVDFAAVSARVLTTQSILKSLKSTVVQMEIVLLEDTKLLQSFGTDDEDLDSAR
nr:uncharacterized protein LOC109181161 [Ipomoea batatas]